MIGLSCCLLQLVSQSVDQGPRLRRYAGPFPIRCQTLPALFFAHELLSEIGVTVAAGNTEIAGFQFVHHFGDRAQLEPTPGNMRRLLGRLSIRCKQRPPRLGYEGEVEGLSGLFIENRKSVLPALLMSKQECDRICHALIGRS